MKSTIIFIWLCSTLLLLSHRSIAQAHNTDKMDSARRVYYRHNISLLPLRLWKDFSLVYEYRFSGMHSLEIGGGWVWNELTDPYYFLRAKRETFEEEPKPFGFKPPRYQCRGPIERLGYKFYPRRTNSYWGIMLSAEQVRQSEPVESVEMTTSETHNPDHYITTNHTVQMYEAGIVKGYTLNGPFHLDMCVGVSMEYVAHKYVLETIHRDLYTSNLSYIYQATTENHTYPLIYVSLRTGIGVGKAAR